MMVAARGRRGAWVVGAGVVAGGYLAADRFLPSHLPAGVLLRGLVLGGLQALVAMGLVLVYRSTRIINFAQAAIGGLAASLAIVLVTGEHWSYYAAVPVGLAGAVATGWVVDAVVARRFAEAPRMIFTVATIGLAQLLGAAQVELPRQLKPSDSTTTFTTPFSFHFRVSPFTFSGDDLVALTAVPLALAALYWFFQRTDTGTAIRAAADSSERAVLLGIPVRRLSAITWMVAAGLSGVGAILSAPILGQNVGVASGPASLLTPLAAAVLAGMESLPLTVLWSVVLAVVSQASSWNYHQAPYTDVIAFVLILGALLVQRRATRRPDGQSLGGFVAMREVPRIPAALAALRAVKVAKVAGLVLVIGAAVLVPLQLPAPRLSTLTYVPIYGIIAVSLVVLAGWAGQISLGQYALVGIGAAVTGGLMVHVHLALPVAMVVASAAGAAVACVVGIPALRIQGLYLAVATLAFAVVASSFLLSSAYVPWLTPATVAQPVLFQRFDLHSPYTLYEFCLLFLVLAMALAWNLRRSWAGRVIVAVRESPRGASAFGISPLKSRLMAFAIAGALAGVAGSLLVVAQQGIPQAPAGFPPDESVSVFAMAVIGGLGSLTGGVLGALYIRGSASFLSDVWQLVVSGAGLLVVLMVWPEGLGGMAFRLRDGALAVLARRAGPPGSTSRGAHARGTGSPADPREAEGVARADGAADPRWDGAFPAGPVHTAALRLAALEDLEVHWQAPSLEGAPVDAPPPDGRGSMFAMAHVDARYGRVPALRSVHLGVAQGEVVALLGTNGAGKTTALKVAAGLIRPTDGSVHYLGTDVTEWSPRRRVEAGIVTVLGGRGVFASLTVTENLRMGAWLARRGHHDEAFATAATRRVLEIFPRLAERGRLRAGLLSGGEQQMLALAQALLCRPRLLLIDELSLGLAPTVVAGLVQVVRDLAESGVTVVIVEQSVNLAASMSDRAVFMERGRLRFSGPTPELSHQPALLRSVFMRAADKAKQRDGRTVRSVPAPTGPRRDLSADDMAAILGGGFSPPAPYVPEEPAPAPELADATAGAATAMVAAPDPVAADDLRKAMTAAPDADAPSAMTAAPDGADDAPSAMTAAPTSSVEAPPGAAGVEGVVAAPDAEPARVRVAPVAARDVPVLPVPALEVVGATKQYGGVAALTDVSLRVMPGEIVGVIGSNGAGKTTLFDVCSGFVVPDAGRVRLLGRDVTRLSPARRAARGLGRVFQDARLFPAITVGDVLRTSLERHVAVRDPVAGALRLASTIRSEVDVAERAQSVAVMFGLERFQDTAVSELSSGTRRVVELATAFAHEPRVLLLDEPSAGIAQRESEALGEMLVALRDETGASFVVIEHDVPLVSSIADRLACMHVGGVIAEGDTAAVLDDPVVVAAYLGSDRLPGGDDVSRHDALGARGVG